MGVSDRHLGGTPRSSPSSRRSPPTPWPAHFSIAAGPCSTAPRH